MPWLHRFHDYMLTGCMLLRLGDVLDFAPSALVKEMEKRMKVIGQGGDTASA
ncbi:hypothetical protein [Delftia sp. UME58]|uniref:hypothetical protein n=1 Tax=Delftia sp. UME58 TaxID=1862322 RepID=UPI0016029643|nr:hypothetical protein [Delftia sp. UME58]